MSSATPSSRTCRRSEVTSRTSRSESADTFPKAVSGQCTSCHHSVAEKRRSLRRTIFPHSVGRPASADGRRSAEFLGETEEKPFRPADVAEPVRVFILDYVAYELRAGVAEPFQRPVDVVRSEHDTKIAPSSARRDGFSVRRKKKRKYGPYEAVKVKLVQTSDPFGSMPVAARRRLLTEIATKARARFEAEYPTLVSWFERYDAVFILSYFAFYYLSTEAGIDKEAIEGKLDFGTHHLELLQALGLTRNRSDLVQAFAPKGEELRKSMATITEYLSMADMECPPEMGDADLMKRLVLSEMRGQSFAIRNWAYPEQAIRHAKRLWGGPLSQLISRDYDGVSIERVINAFAELVNVGNDRLNDHIRRVRSVLSTLSCEESLEAYSAAFPSAAEDADVLSELLEERCGDNLEALRWTLVVHSDQWLPEIFTFSLEDVAVLYGDKSCCGALKRLLNQWSHQFGDLSEANPKHFLYSNPVLTKPLIRLTDERYFFCLYGMFGHMVSGMLEKLIQPTDRQYYLAKRSQYLEDTTEALFRNAFPSASVFRGSQWSPTGERATVFENDLLLVIDTTAIVVECKAHLVDAPARRGAEYRLIDTLEALVVGASQQATRFVAFLKNHPARHSFTTKSGYVNEVNISRVVRYIPLSVTFENLGFVSANLRQAIDAGLIPGNEPIVPSLCFTDVETVFETLETQAQRVHYLARRSELEKTMSYRGDELDLFGFYLNNGFNIGELELGKTFVNLTMLSKELDPYFVGRADGVAVAKPSLKLTEWWSAILKRLEAAQMEFWTEMAYALLSVAYEEQFGFEKNLGTLAEKVERGRCTQRHNSVAMRSGTNGPREYIILGYPYGGTFRGKNVTR
jgi:hypothetical protein